MTPARFTECLLRIRWSHVDLANELQCDLALVEAWEAGQQSVPDRLARWLDALANAHEEHGTPTAYRGWGILPQT